jgi:hypothetical protein
VGRYGDKPEFGADAIKSLTCTVAPQHAEPLYSTI